MKVAGITNKILIADDDRTNRAFLKRGVSSLPYEFTFVESGTEALEKILSQGFDLLILDIIMPGLSGFEVIKELKKQRPKCNTPFIFLTGQSEADSITEGFSLGAVDYITKPFSLIEVKLRIKTHHDLYKSRFELKQYAEHMETLANERAEQLIHSDRLATLGTMAAGIMHEINNPTTFISGNIQLMQHRFFPVIEQILKDPQYSENSKVQFILKELPEIFSDIRKGISRIKKITDGLKSFSRHNKQKSRLLPIDLRECIENAIAFTKSSIADNIEIIYENPESDFLCFTEPQEVEQIIINIIINSSHALEKIDAPKIYIKLQRDHEAIICRIGDNGLGIPKDIIQKVWQPFFTTKPAGKGTGLGLAICRQIIQSHKGSLDYTGEYGKGAEFTLKLKNA